MQKKRIKPTGYLSSVAFIAVALCTLCEVLPAQVTTEQTKFETKSITRWVGERFVFLKYDPQLQKYGYQLISSGEDILGFGPLPYEAYVGKIAMVTNVEESSRSGSYEIEMIVENVGTRLSAKAFGGTIDGLGLLADIERAKSLYVGRTLWRKAGSILKLDERTGKSSLITLDPFDPLKVISVTSGSLRGPVRFVVLAASGVKGYEDVRMSDTNSSTKLTSGRFEHEFQLDAPPRDTAEAARTRRPSPDALKRAADGKDVLGWQQAWWGMTSAELLSAFGQKLQKLPNREAFTNLFAEYIIPVYEVGQHSYKVTFQMDNVTSRLKQVLINADFPQDGLYKRAFEEVEALLSQRYGAAVYKADQQERLVNLIRHWVFPTTTIELHYTFMKGMSNTLTIAYHPSISNPANRL